MNCVVGENGSGKTNTLDAICFALGDKVSNLRVDSADNLFNEGILHHSGRSMSVKLVFSLKNGSKKTTAEILTTQTKTQKVVMLNGRKISQKKLREYCEKTLQISVDPALFIIRQNQVASLIEKSPKELYIDLCEATGAKRFFDCATQWTRQQEKANKTCAKIRANIQTTQLEIDSEQLYLENLRETRQLESDIADLERQHADLTLGLDRITQRQLQRDLDSGRDEEDRLQDLIESLSDSHRRLKENCNQITANQSRLHSILQFELPEIKSDLQSNLTRIEETMNINKERAQEIVAMLEHKQDSERSISKKLCACQGSHQSKTADAQKLELTIKGYRLQKQAVDDQICELSNGDSDKSYVVEQRQTIQEQKAHFSKLEAKQKVTGNTIRQSLKYNTDRMSLRTKEQAELESKIQTATASLQSLKKMREQEADHQHSSCSQQLKQHDENIQHTLVHMNIHLQELELRSKEIGSRFSFIETQAKYFRAVDGYLGSVFELFRFKASAKQVMTALALLMESNLKVHVVKRIDDAGKILEIAAKKGIEIRIWPLESVTKKKDARTEKLKADAVKKFSQKVDDPMDFIDCKDEQYFPIIQKALGGNRWLIARDDNTAAKLLRSFGLNSATTNGTLHRPSEFSGGALSKRQHKTLAHMKFEADFLARTIDEEKQKKLRALKQIKFEERRAQLCQQQATLEKEVKQLQLSLDEVKVALQNCQDRKVSLAAQQDKLEEDEANTKRELQYLEMKEKALLPDSSSEQMLKKLNLIRNHISVKAAAASTDLQHIVLTLQSLNDKIIFLEEQQRSFKEADIVESRERAKAEKERLTEEQKSNFAATHRLREKILMVEEEIHAVLVKQSDEASKLQKCRQDADQTSKELKTTQKEVKAHQKSQACVCANLEKLTQKLSKTTAINVEEDGDLEKIQDKLCAVVAQKEKCQASANQRKRQKVSYEKNHKRVNPLILEDKIRNSTVFQRRLQVVQESMKQLEQGITSSKDAVIDINCKAMQKIRRRFKDCCRELLPKSLSIDIVPISSSPETVHKGIKFVLYKVNGEETSISQLSGGQKTLVGLAFLCALACYRKFPFYLLDEVDAALDQQNQHRCARLVRHTLGQSQVICISHHKAFFKNAQTVINVKRDKNGNTKIDC